MTGEVSAQSALMALFGSVAVFWMMGRDAAAGLGTVNHQNCLI